MKRVRLRLEQNKTPQPCRISRSRSRRNRGPRLVGRTTLIRALASEYEHGNSASRLYVSLLARAVIEQDPRLLERMPYELECCGIESEARSCRPLTAPSRSTRR